MASITPAATADAAARAQWAAALDALELSLDDAARAMTVSTNADGGVIPTLPAWTPPLALGALPAELAVRVQDLLTNQQKLIGELEQARTLTLRHLTAVRSVPPERDARASVYLDVNG
ncbi:hypothetical protein E3O06_15020 [Cryobacterium glaciale]|uniref:Flagellar protein FlgN n=1 Tax=Cryobacterium glaciale TaxID=1259145 RepID=A0A4V3I7P0_9MICO|nr:hypothetical protein [Cryobacterium glaciale]TFB69638.1 hypothetical protein E3O06_15020 [Cryobacterium glaciale]